METIRYISGGLLGDFIHQLSVINETYIRTGRKGILYISNTGDAFRLGLEKAYKDTYPFVINQPYIHEYTIHNGEDYDIDLSIWRKDLEKLKPNNWYGIFKSVYDVEWGTHPWLYGCKLLPEFQNKVVFNCTSTRFPTHVDFKALFEMIGFDMILFVTQNIDDYTYFNRNTGIELNIYIPSSLEHLVNIIHSCTCFIGSLTSALTFAYALHKKNVTLLKPHTTDLFLLYNTLKYILPETHMISSIEVPFYGQHKEDVFIKSIFPKYYRGTCIEVGAYDGKTFSNTYHFEQSDWKCLCIEPITSAFEACKTIRREVVQCCISDKDYEDKEFTIFHINTNACAISSLEPDTRLVESHKHLITNKTTEMVKIRSLTSLMDELQFPKYIDFISIDTENTELDVLKGIDFSRYSIKLLIIENNYDEPFCEDYLKQFGYKKIHRIAVNDFFLRSF